MNKKDLQQETAYGKMIRYWELRPKFRQEAGGRGQSRGTRTKRPSM